MDHATLSVAFRAASSDDLPSLARLVSQTPLWQRYGVTPDIALASLGAGLMRGDGVRVALEGGSIAGFFWVLAHGGFGRSPYLKWLGVRPGYSSRGLGTLLLRAAEQHAQNIHPELLLLCSDFNVRGQKFYEREGYRRVGALPDYVLPGVTELVYFKRLAPLTSA